ncbi:hypothetical protein NM688_g437 [Phlebia brevispora]|uniref:Uncharacterized protein n=1 Tax=Phlebia brevispora TaxID=194682 RepID=A0ACC1TEI1_9APHY|nr:hypothetical protein NM688_g437 [Phlebia brevispora]
MVSFLRLLTLPRFILRLIIYVFWLPPGPPQFPITIAPPQRRVLALPPAFHPLLTIDPPAVTIANNSTYADFSYPNWTLLCVDALCTRAEPYKDETSTEDILWFFLVILTLVLIFLSACVFTVRHGLSRRAKKVADDTDFATLSDEDKIDRALLQNVVSYSVGDIVITEGQYTDAPDLVLDAVYEPLPAIDLDNLVIKSDEMDTSSETIRPAGISLDHDSNAISVLDSTRETVSTEPNADVTLTNPAEMKAGPPSQNIVIDSLAPTLPPTPIPPYMNMATLESAVDAVLAPVSLKDTTSSSLSSCGTIDSSVLDSASELAPDSTSDAESSPQASVSDHLAAVIPSEDPMSSSLEPADMSTEETPTATIDTQGELDVATAVAKVQPDPLSQEGDVPCDAVETAQAAHAENLEDYVETRDIAFSEPTAPTLSPVESTSEPLVEHRDPSRALHATGTPPSDIVARAAEPLRADDNTSLIEVAFVAEGSQPSPVAVSDEALVKNAIASPALDVSDVPIVSSETVLHDVDVEDLHTISPVTSIAASEVAVDSAPFTVASDDELEFVSDPTLSFDVPFEVADTPTDDALELHAGLDVPQSPVASEEAGAGSPVLVESETDEVSLLDDRDGPLEAVMEAIAAVPELAGDANPDDEARLPVSLSSKFFASPIESTTQPAEKKPDEDGLATEERVPFVPVDVEHDSSGVSPLRIFEDEMSSPVATVIDPVHPVSEEPTALVEEALKSTPDTPTDFGATTSNATDSATPETTVPDPLALRSAHQPVAETQEDVPDAGRNQDAIVSEVSDDDSKSAADDMTIVADSDCPIATPDDHVLDVQKVPSPTEEAPEASPAEPSASESGDVVITADDEQSPPDISDDTDSQALQLDFSADMVPETLSLETPTDGSGDVAGTPNGESLGAQRLSSPVEIAMPSDNFVAEDSSVAIHDDVPASEPESRELCAPGSDAVPVTPVDDSADIEGRSSSPSLDFEESTGEDGVTAEVSPNTSPVNPVVESLENTLHDYEDITASTTTLEGSSPEELAEAPFETPLQPMTADVEPKDNAVESQSASEVLSPEATVKSTWDASSTELEPPSALDNLPSSASTNQRTDIPSDDSAEVIPDVPTASSSSPWKEHSDSPVGDSSEANDSADENNPVDDTEKPTPTNPESPSISVEIATGDVKSPEAESQSAEPMAVELSFEEPSTSEPTLPVDQSVGDSLSQPPNGSEESIEASGLEESAVTEPLLSSVIFVEAEDTDSGEPAADLPAPAVSMQEPTLNAVEPRTPTQEIPKPTASVYGAELTDANPMEALSTMAESWIVLPQEEQKAEGVASALAAHTPAPGLAAIPEQDHESDNSMDSSLLSEQPVSPVEQESLVASAILTPLSDEQAAVVEQTFVDEQVPIEEQPSVSAQFSMNEEVLVEQQAPIDEQAPVEQSAPADEQIFVDEEAPVEEMPLVEDQTAVEEDLVENDTKEEVPAEEERVPLTTLHSEIPSIEMPTTCAENTLDEMPTSSEGETEDDNSVSRHIEDSEVDDFERS